MAAQKSRPRKKSARGGSSCGDAPKLVVPYPVPLKEAMEPTVRELQDKLEEVLEPYVIDANLSDQSAAELMRVGRMGAEQAVWKLLARMVACLADKSLLAKQTLLLALTADLIDTQGDK